MRFSFFDAISVRETPHTAFPNLQASATAAAQHSPPPGH